MRFDNEHRLALVILAVVLACTVLCWALGGDL